MNKRTDYNAHAEKRRCEELAEYIIKTECTVREAAKKFSISKSTVHKDVTERLKNINSVYFVFVLCLVLLFFGVLVFLNCVLSIFSNVFKID